MKKIILLLTLLLSGCARIKIQDYLYPISIGLDYINNEYIIYYQIVSYSKISMIENESSIDSNYETVIMKGKGKSIYEALKDINYLTKNSISRTHIRSFIVSKNLIENNSKYLSDIKYFFDINYLRSNINIFTTESILDIYKASKIIDNTPYSNEINHPHYYEYIKPNNYLNFLKNVFDNRVSYLPYITINKDDSSYIGQGELKENIIVEIDGAYFINLDKYHYLNNDSLKGNYYLFNRENIGIEVNNAYMNAKKLKFNIKYSDNIIFDIKIINSNFYLNDLSIDTAKELFIDKIKKDIDYTYTLSIDKIDIFNLNDYKNKLNLNSNYEVKVTFKNITSNYSSTIK